MKKIKKYVLIKDIVIPAGTVFGDESGRTSRYGEGFVSHAIGLSPNTHGEINYFLPVQSACEDDDLTQWFRELV